jgi:hypothetical protein
LTYAFPDFSLSGCDVLPFASWLADHFPVIKKSMLIQNDSSERLMPAIVGALIGFINSL